MISGTPFGSNFGAPKKAPPRPVRAPARAPVRPAARPTVQRPTPMPNQAVATLQRALALLAMQVRDQGLAVKVDGLIGPATVRATNLAMVRYVKRPAQFATGRLTLAQVNLNAQALANSISAAAQRPAPVVAARAATVTKPVPAATAKPTRSPTLARLQQALVALGTITKQAALKITADGLVGPKTVRAVAVATGKQMTAVQVVANAELLAREVEAKIAARGKVPPSKPKDAPPGKLRRSDAVAHVQQLLTQIATLTNDPAIAVVVDGITGPKTVAAVNKVLKTKFSVASVARDAKAIAGRLAQHIAASGAQPAQEQPAPQAEPAGGDPAIAADSPAAEQAAQQAQVQAQAAQQAVAADPVATAAAATAQQQFPTGLDPSPGVNPGDGGGGIGPATPSTTTPEYYPPGVPTPADISPGAEGGAVPAEGNVAPGPVAAKPFPWIWVAGGVLAAVGVGGTFLLMRKRDSAAEPARRSISRSNTKRAMRASK